MGNYQRRPTEFSFWKCDYKEDDFEFSDLAKVNLVCWCHPVGRVMNLCSCDCHEDLNPRERRHINN